MNLATKWTCYLIWIRFFLDSLGIALLLYLARHFNPLMLGLSLALLASSLGLYFKRMKIFSYFIIALVAYSLIRQAIALYPHLDMPKGLLVGPLVSIAYDAVMLIFASFSLKQKSSITVA